MKISGFENKDYRNGFDEGYEKGRADEREEWKTATSELLIKYAGDIYEALPDIVKQIKADAIDEFIKTIRPRMKWDNDIYTLAIEHCIEVAEQLRGQK